MVDVIGVVWVVEVPRHVHVRAFCGNPAPLRERAVGFRRAKQRGRSGVADVEHRQPPRRPYRSCRRRRSRPAPRSCRRTRRSRGTPPPRSMPPPAAERPQQPRRPRPVRERLRPAGAPLRSPRRPGPRRPASRSTRLTSRVQFHHHQPTSRWFTGLPSQWNPTELLLYQVVSLGCVGEVRTVTLAVEYSTVKLTSFESQRTDTVVRRHVHRSDPWGEPVGDRADDACVRPAHDPRGLRPRIPRRLSLPKSLPEIVTWLPMGAWLGERLEISGSMPARAGCAPDSARNDPQTARGRAAAKRCQNGRHEARTWLPPCPPRPAPAASPLRAALPRAGTHAQ